MCVKNSKNKNSKLKLNSLNLEYRKYYLCIFFFETKHYLIIIMMLLGITIYTIIPNCTLWNILWIPIKIFHWKLELKYFLVPFSSTYFTLFHNILHYIYNVLYIYLHKNECVVSLRLLKQKHVLIKMILILF